MDKETVSLDDPRESNRDMQSRQARRTHLPEVSMTTVASDQHAFA